MVLVYWCSKLPAIYSKLLSDTYVHTQPISVRLEGRPAEWPHYTNNACTSMIGGLAIYMLPRLLIRGKLKMLLMLKHLYQ